MEFIDCGTTIYPTYKKVRVICYNDGLKVDLIAL